MVLTLTYTTPFPTGETAVMDLFEFILKLVAGVEPNLTAVTFLKLLPAKLTDVPPASGPVLGDRWARSGARSGPSLSEREEESDVPWCEAWWCRE